ncbi:MAG: tRNA (guanosine(46)-N7)-methyltransferase TrmB [Legionella sp.]|nr:tRNA (guanosine(46)-N7)-methyltransferase TrmB [Legionella sp.]
MTEVKPTLPRRIKSFVQRAGRLSPRQHTGLTILLPSYALSLEDSPWDLNAIFGRTANTIVEIGFGSGASLLAMAKAEPDKDFIGIEVYKAGIGAVAATLQEQKITNVRLASFDAVTVFKECIAANALAGVQIFFPDPWPKKRHHKRRLIQSEFVQLLISRLQPGGFLHCATDWACYAAHMYDILSEAPQLSFDKFQFQPGGDETKLDEIKNRALYPFMQDKTYHHVPARPLTRFETRGLKLGHSIWDFVYRKC